MRKLWTISRLDKRDRCAKCLRAFKYFDSTWKDERYRGQRFSRVGVCCRVISKNLTKSQFPHDTLNICKTH